MTTDNSNFSVDHLAHTHEVFNQSQALEDINSYADTLGCDTTLSGRQAEWQDFLDSLP